MIQYIPHIYGAQDHRSVTNIGSLVKSHFYILLLALRTSLRLISKTCLRLTHNFCALPPTFEKLFVLLKIRARRERSTKGMKQFMKSNPDVYKLRFSALVHTTTTFTIPHHTANINFYNFFRLSTSWWFAVRWTSL